MRGAGAAKGVGRLDLPRLRLAGGDLFLGFLDAARFDSRPVEDVINVGRLDRQATFFQCIVNVVRLGVLSEAAWIA